MRNNTKTAHRKIYLAGSIYETEPGASWKNKFRKIIQTSSFSDMREWTILDPNPQRNGTTGLEVVPRDKKVIASSDYLVAYYEKLSVGTTMEILYAHMTNTVQVFFIDPTGEFSENLWIKAHIHRAHRTVEDCAKALLDSENSILEYRIKPELETQGLYR